MRLMTQEQRKALIENGRNEGDHVPVLKIFNPCGAATWIITEIDPRDPDLLFGLCDLGFGFPELGSVSFTELRTVKGPLGIGLERDKWFEAKHPLSVYTAAARKAARIVEDSASLDAAAAASAAVEMEAA